MLTTAKRTLAFLLYRTQSGLDNSLFYRARILLRGLVARLSRIYRTKSSPITAGAFPELERLIQCYNTLGENVPPVLYLGDSVVERVSRNDLDTRHLGQMVIDNLSHTRRVLCISHSAYQIELFNAFARALARMRYRPRIVILPINLRSFSPQWDLNPEWQFIEELRTIEKFAQNSSVGSLKTGKRTLSIEEFEATTVSYPHTSFTCIGQFRQLIKMGAEVDEQKAFRWQQIFVFHYMHPLSRDHPKLRLIHDTVARLAELGILILVYITPINFQAGQKLIGADFMTAIQHQVSLVSEQVSYARREEAVRFLDFSTVLSSDYFFHEYNPTEHLNERGRYIISKKIADEVIDLSS